MTTTASDVLAGRRILVVEDEFLTADEIVRTLRGSGAEILGAVPTVQEALALIHASPLLDAAIIDVKLAGEFSYPVAEALKARATPFVFSTVFRRDQLPDRFRQSPHSAKPMQPPVLLALLTEALASAPLPVPPATDSGDGESALRRPDRETAAETPMGEIRHWIALVGQHRDREAFAELFRAVAPKVKGYMLRSGMPASVAEELAQEVMLTVWRKAELYEPSRGSAMAWVFTVARNARVNLIRREYAGRLSIDWVGDLPQATPEEILGQNDETRRIHQALQELPPDQAEVLRRSFLYSQPHPEIARALGLPLGTVKSRLRLAMARLRAKLGDEIS